VALAAKESEVIYYSSIQTAVMVEPTSQPAVHTGRFNGLLTDIKRLNSKVNDLETLLGIQHLCSISPHLEIDFSSRCNLRCPMCHQSKREMGTFQLDTNAVNILIDSLPARDTVMIAGLGEPLLYPGLEVFLRHTALFQCRTHLFTNGQLINRKLDALRQVNRISVSMDGATQATFETLRRGAQFRRVCRNIEMLREFAPNTELVTSTVVSRFNVNELAAIVALAESLGMDEVHLSPVDHTEALALRPQDWTVFEQQLAKVQGRHIRIKNNVQAGHFESDRNSEQSTIDQQLSALMAAPPLNADALPLPMLLLPTIDSHIQHLSASEQVDELERRIDVLETRRKELLGMLPTAHPGLPHCSIPWKYGFAQSNGAARLCPYAEVNVGTLGDVLGCNYNSSLLGQVRSKMDGNTPLLHVCQHCTDEHRQFRRETLVETLAQISRPTPRLRAVFVSRLSRLTRRVTPPRTVARLRRMGRALTTRALGNRAGKPISHG
jgi:wyosine [tRNA(Phe)-imidazoG37] synthetase (radical SAM superfamily)